MARARGAAWAWVLGAALATAAPRGASAQFLSASPVERPPLAPDETLVDAVVASVDLEGDRRPPVFVLGSEVELMLRFELTVRGAPAALTTSVDVSVSRGIVEQVIGEKLLQREAGRAGDPPPTTAAIEEERARWVPRLVAVGGLRALLRATGASAADFEGLIRRRLVVARFLERHLARSIEPTEVELRAAYDEERFGAFRAEGVPFAVARAEIREALVRAGYPRAIRAYLRSISSRARVRLYVDGAAGG